MSALDPELVRRIQEDERDRLYVEANTDRFELCKTPSEWLRSRGAMVPAARARLRADQPAGEGGEA